MAAPRHDEKKPLPEVKELLITIHTGGFLGLGGAKKEVKILLTPTGMKYESEENKQISVTPEFERHIINYWKANLKNQDLLLNLRPFMVYIVKHVNGNLANQRDAGNALQAFDRQIINYWNANLDKLDLLFPLQPLMERIAKYDVAGNFANQCDASNALKEFVPRALTTVTSVPDSHDLMILKKTWELENLLYKASSGDPAAIQLFIKNVAELETVADRRAFDALYAKIHSKEVPQPQRKQFLDINLGEAIVQHLLNQRDNETEFLKLRPASENSQPLGLLINELAKGDDVGYPTRARVWLRDILKDIDDKAADLQEHSRAAAGPGPLARHRAAAAPASPELKSGHKPLAQLLEAAAEKPDDKRKILTFLGSLLKLEKSDPEFIALYAKIQSEGTPERKQFLAIQPQFAEAIITHAKSKFNRSETSDNIEKMVEKLKNYAAPDKPIGKLIDVNLIIGATDPTPARVRVDKGAIEEVKAYLATKNKPNVEPPRP